MEEKQPTIYDVAKKAGVSIATVSRGLSGGSISAASLRKVEDAAKELGYRPVSALRAENESRPAKRTIAIVLSSISNPYNASLLQGAAEHALNNGFLPQLYYYPDATTTCERVVEDLLDQQPAGVMLAGFTLEDGLTQDISAQLTRLRQAMPLVAIGPPIEGFDCPRLTSDPAACVRKAVRHLAQLGHRRIAMIGGSRGVRFSDLRERAFYEEMAAVSGPVPPTYVQLTGFTAQAGKIGVNLMLGGCTEELPPPTAIFAINDLAAMGAMQQLQSAGLRIPEDVSIIGCDNDFFAPYLNPPLSTVDLHPSLHGEQAMACLMIAIGGGNPYSFDSVCECSLIIRDSCAAVPTKEASKDGR